MNINQARKMATDLMAQYGLTDWGFQFDRSVRRLGYCSYTRRYISLGLHATTVNDEAEVRNTILHEIAHALAGYEAGHGPEWQMTHKEMGGDGERCGAIAVKAPHTWEMICPKCQVKWKRYRRPSPTLIHTACRSQLNVYRVNSKNEVSRV